MINKLFISLQQADRTICIGTKGKNLRILSNHGVNVPITYCITSEAYRQFVVENKLEEIIREQSQNWNLSAKTKSDNICKAILASSAPVDLVLELSVHDFLKSDNAKYAIRSSSNLEDLANTSFAGLYESFLNVSGFDNILNAVKMCWTSLWSERAIEYREKYRLSHLQAEMSVLIQQMIDPLFSGVCFTEDPLGMDNKFHLEYCEGLGDDLLSGRVAPYSCEIKKISLDVHHLMTPLEKKLDDASIRRLSDIFQNIETLMGCPQDIEWATTVDNYYILQTRPIIRKSFSSSYDKVWTRANIGEVLPNVITPLTWDVFRATLSNNKNIRETVQSDSEPAKDGVRMINGRGYLRLDVFLNSFCYLPAVTPLVMNRALGVDLPETLDHYSRPSGLRVRLAQSLFLFDSLGLIPRLRWMAALIPPLYKIQTGTIDGLIKWTAHCFRLHIKSTAYAIGSFGLLAWLLKRWMSPEAANFLPAVLLGQQYMQTSAQGTDLCKLAEYVQANSCLSDLFKDDSDLSEIGEHLSDISDTKAGKHFLGLFQSFLEMNGARAAGELELSIPRWREDPLFIWDIIRQYLKSTIPTADNTIQARRLYRREIMAQIKASLNAPRWLIFSALLNAYSEYVTSRENLKYKLVEGFEAIRHLYLAIARDMTDGGILECADDIFFLRAEEISKKYPPYTSPEIKCLIRERKEQYRIWKTQAVPALIIEGHQTAIPISSVGELKGIGCSPGKALGVARVLFDTSEASSLQPGEILVTPHTDPGWTPLFLVCKALVTEIGGFLSHGSTVAREYGIPAVVNVSGATKCIHTGDYILVDGTYGTVTISNIENQSKPTQQISSTHSLMTDLNITYSQHLNK